jgi:hypothetical protein
MIKIKKFVAIPLIGVTMLGAGAVAGYATLAGAQTTTNNNAAGSFMSGMSRYHTAHINGTITSIKEKPGRHHRKGPGLMGKVTAVNGTVITVTRPDGTAYTVNAGDATVQKMVTGSLADVRVGDTIGVKGAVSGTSVTATTIMDDVPTPPAMQ